MLIWLNHITFIRSSAAMNSLSELSSLPHEVRTAFLSLTIPGLLTDWAWKRSIAMTKAAYLIYDDTKRVPLTPAGYGDGLEPPHMLAAHHLLTYAHNLQIFGDNICGLTTWKPIQHLSIGWRQRVEPLVTILVGLFPQATLDKVSLASLFSFLSPPSSFSLWEM